MFKNRVAQTALSQWRFSLISIDSLLFLVIAFNYDYNILHFVQNVNRKAQRRADLGNNHKITPKEQYSAITREQPNPCAGARQN
ncbi:hypothetical protein J6TS1_47460 [Siminovitchia terrae]|uniref:Uncharacterized protein n=1 Tax=Siminovitchia terrae TaxID=1914933 RepID=A0ABQ4L4Q9_SIMTE|nr:hypothetical protein J22TS1_38200 [Siminovitchia terrae]GIN98876.1 hypothetical protein J6TS1_47460 [Siminovitchia terrae]